MTTTAAVHLSLLLLCGVFSLPSKIHLGEIDDAESGLKMSSFFRVLPSIRSFDAIESPQRVSLLSYHVDHHSDAQWLLPSLHLSHSVGWNYTVHNASTWHRPYSCTIRFLGVGFESTLQGYQHGGSGYLTLSYHDGKKMHWMGFSANVSERLHCYYRTNKDTGSEFLDKPKTLGIAVYCPVTLDQDVGPFLFRRKMETGYFCRPLAEYKCEATLHFFPTGAQSEKEEIIAEVETTPAYERSMTQRAMTRSDPRPHAVCTVQTFMHSFTGPILYMFIAYYQMLGWRVIVYDRFGFHYRYIQELLTLPGVDYYPFTVHQVTQTSKYNQQFKSAQGVEMKSFYKMEVNWGYSSKKLADTADQDADKTRTYDYARLEYAHLDTMLYVDADELLFCPQAGQSVATQRAYHQQLHDGFVAKGIEEMRYVRIPYSGIAPADFDMKAVNRSMVDFTNHTGECMNRAFAAKSLLQMAQCWSTGTSFDNFPKSADLAGVCPFHYNHWSCDGMRGGGRDATKSRCRCKVGFDMQNGYEYRPFLKRCHLIHLNDNKYRFQSKRTKHAYDKGDITKPCPIAPMLQGKGENARPAEKDH